MARGKAPMTAEDQAGRRFPKRLYRAGRSPIPASTWPTNGPSWPGSRTSLTLLAAGVPLQAPDPPIAETLRLSSALVLVPLGLLAPVQGWIGWVTPERALRSSRPLPSLPLRLRPVLAVGTTVAGVLVLIGLALR